VLSGTFKMC